MTYVQRFPQLQLPEAGLPGRTLALLAVAGLHVVLVVVVVLQLDHVRLPWDPPVVHPVTLIPTVKKTPPNQTPIRTRIESVNLNYPPPELPRAVPESDEAPPPWPPAGPDPVVGGGGPGSGPDTRIVLPRQDPAHPVTRPAYPPTSARLGETGAVTLHICLDGTGAPTDVTVRESSGYRRLDEAALRHLRRPSTRFLPGTENGVAVPMCTDFRVRFDLTP